MHAHRLSWSWAVVFMALWSFSARARGPNISATVIDYMGNRHEVSRLLYQGHLEVEYYVGDQRYVVPLSEIDRIQLRGDRGQDEQPVTVYLRAGRKEEGQLFTGGSGIIPQQDVVGSGQLANQLSGRTELGPFFILLNDVREIILHHPRGQASKEMPLQATVVNLDGKRFEVSGLRYRGQARLEFVQGRKKRKISLSKIAQIEFEEKGSTSTEQRPILITFWSGKQLSGTVNASVVRLPGESDRLFEDRLTEAFTGQTDAGDFSIGMYHVKLIRFHKELPKEKEKKEAQESREKSGEPDSVKKLKNE